MKNLALIFISLLSLIVVFMLEPIPQSLSYHQFADQQPMFGIPHALNALSNIAYLIIGYYGYRLINSNKKVELVASIRHVYRLFFISVAFVGLGSFYYHLSPNNSSLLWDRLPMAIAFMSFLTIVIAEYINEKLATKLFLPLILISTSSVLYWYWTESIGHGDLRMYILIQYLPVLLMPVIFSLYTSPFTMRFYFWLVLVCYGLAKGFEIMDFELYELTKIISGHTLKHLMSAAGPYMLYLALKKRKKRTQANPNVS